MRFAAVAAAAWLCLLPLAGGFSATPPETAPSAPTDAKPPPAPATAPSASPASGDAAAKHAKRTACLKDAKTKKLVGADKTTFLKNCIAAP
jgi:hypothetical protein